MSVKDRNKELQEAMKQKKAYREQYEANPGRFIFNFLIALIGIISIEALFFYIMDNMDTHYTYIPKGPFWIIIPLIGAYIYARKKQLNDPSLIAKDITETMKTYSQQIQSSTNLILYLPENGIQFNLNKTGIDWEIHCGNSNCIYQLTYNDKQGVLSLFVHHPSFGVSSFGLYVSKDNPSNIYVTIVSPLTLKRMEKKIIEALQRTGVSILV